MPFAALLLGLVLGWHPPARPVDPDAGDERLAALLERALVLGDGADLSAARAAAVELESPDGAWLVAVAAVDRGADVPGATERADVDAAEALLRARAALARGALRRSVPAASGAADDFELLWEGLAALASEDGDDGLDWRARLEDGGRYRVLERPDRVVALAWAPRRAIAELAPVLDPPTVERARAGGALLEARRRVARGRPAEALPLLERAVAALPPRRGLLLELASCAHAAGDPERARASFAAALRLPGTLDRDELVGEQRAARLLGDAEADARVSPVLAGLGAPASEPDARWALLLPAEGTAVRRGAFAARVGDGLVVVAFGKASWSRPDGEPPPPWCREHVADAARTDGLDELEALLLDAPRDAPPPEWSRVGEIAPRPGTASAWSRARAALERAVRRDPGALSAELNRTRPASVAIVERAYGVSARAVLVVDPERLATAAEADSGAELVPPGSVRSGDPSAEWTAGVEGPESADYAAWRARAVRSALWSVLARSGRPTALARGGVAEAAPAALPSLVRGVGRRVDAAGDAWEVRFSRPALERWLARLDAAARPPSVHVAPRGATDAEAEVVATALAAHGLPPADRAEHAELALALAVEVEAVRGATEPARIAGVDKRSWVATARAALVLPGAGEPVVVAASVAEGERRYDEDASRRSAHDAAVAALAARDDLGGRVRAAERARARAGLELELRGEPGELERFAASLRTLPGVLRPPAVDARGVLRLRFQGTAPDLCALVELRSVLAGGPEDRIPAALGPSRAVLR